MCSYARKRHYYEDYYLMKRIILLLVVLLETACIFFLCWFPAHKKGETDFNNASITIANELKLTLTVDTTVQSSSEQQPLNLKKGDKVRARRLTNSSVEFYGDETKDYQGSLPIESFDETDMINELLKPARSAEEFRKEDYLDSCLIKNVVVCVDFFAVIGGLCLLASIKHDWLGFVVNIILIAIFAIFVLACREPLAVLLF